MNEKKEMVVVAIENGTVIDHINPEKLFKVVELLHLDKIASQITVGNNLKSNKLGGKGIIKITDVFLDAETINRIALIAPNAKLNIIRNFKVVEKGNIHLPNTIEDIVKCINPKCITNNEPIKSRFHVVDRNNVAIKCHYCEHIIQQEDVKMK